MKKLRDRIGLIFLKLGARISKSDTMKFSINENHYEIRKHAPKHYSRWDDLMYRLP